MSRVLTSPFGNSVERIAWMCPLGVKNCCRRRTGSRFEENEALEVSTHTSEPLDTNLCNKFWPNAA